MHWILDFFVLIKCLEMSLVHYSRLLTLIVDAYYPLFGINHKTSFPHQHNIMPISLYLERNSRFDQTATQRKTTKACWMSQSQLILCNIKTKKYSHMIGLCHWQNLPLEKALLWPQFTKSHPFSTYASYHRFFDHLPFARTCKHLDYSLSLIAYVILSIW